MFQIEIVVLSHSILPTQSGSLLNMLISLNKSTLQGWQMKQFL